MTRRTQKEQLTAPGSGCAEFRFEARDPDEFCERFEFMDPNTSVRSFGGRSFRIALRGYRLSHTAVFMAQVERGRVVTTPKGYVGLTVPMDGAGQIVDGRRRESYRQGSAHVRTDDYEFDLRCQASFKCLVVHLDRPEFQSFGRRLNGAETAFGSDALPLSLGQVADVWPRLASVWTQLNERAGAEFSPAKIREIEDSLLTMLHLQSGNKFDGGNQTCRQGHLQRAVDYIMPNLAEPISLADLTHAAGVSASTLLRAFSERYQTTPMAFLRERRLEAVQRVLLASDPQEGLVTKTALRYGFGHLSRFAADYYRAFGERPSETLRARTGLGLAS
jgi:AraC-like DNA-binding protein